MNRRFQPEADSLTETVCMSESKFSHIVFREQKLLINMNLVQFPCPPPFSIFLAFFEPLFFDDPSRCISLSCDSSRPLGPNLYHQNVSPFYHSQEEISLSSCTSSDQPLRRLDSRQRFRRCITASISVAGIRAGVSPLHHDQGTVLGCVSSFYLGFALSWALPRPDTTQLPLRLPIRSVRCRLFRLQHINNRALRNLTPFASRRNFA